MLACVSCGEVHEHHPARGYRAADGHPYRQPTPEPAKARVPECAYCGFPGLRAEGHASWCEAARAWCKPWLQPTMNAEAMLALRARGESIAEIAARAGVSEAVVKGRLQRWRERAR